MLHPSRIGTPWPALRGFALAALAAGLFACGGKGEADPEGSPAAGGEQTGGDDEPGTGATAPSGGEGGDGASETGGTIGATGGSATGGDAGDGAGGADGGGAESGGSGGTPSGGSSGDAAGDGSGDSGGTPSGGSAGAPSGGTGGVATGGAVTGGSGLGGIPTGGATTGGSASGGEGTGGVFDPGDDPSVSTQLDLLLVVDNSLSMADKQALFAEAIPAVVLRLVNPPCVDAEGLTVAEPATPDEACPAGSTREILPVDDLHVGVVSSSLGGHGGYICSPAEGSAYVPEKDDRGELIGPLRGVTTYQDQGFLKWDPRGLGTPPGQSDPAAFAAEVAALVAAAGDTGCGYEAPLESWYRFLVDPEPPLEVVLESSRSVRTGVNTTLLEQRAAFLRPSSALAIVMLGDENDCSVIDFGPGYVVGGLDGSTRLPRGTAACAEDPNDPCCRSCALAEVEPPEGCTPLAEDATCLLGNYGFSEDPLNLRCFDQKRRFGIDLLYPTERYVRALTSPTIVRDGDGAEIENPLFAAGRDPSLVTVVGIVGVPWQLLAAPGAEDEPLTYRTATELHDEGLWPAIVGDVATLVPPLDPFMVESIAPRTVLGPSPVTGLAPEPPEAAGATSPVNGHERTSADGGDLQFACTYPLAEPRVCEADSTAACDCKETDPNLTTNPLCQAAGSTTSVTTQYWGKAYPGLRQLEVLRALGPLAVPASICARVTGEDRTDPDWGYAPAARAMIERLEDLLE